METPGPDGHGADAAEMQKLRDLHARWTSRGSGLRRRDLRDHAEARPRDRELVELGVAAAEVVARAS